MKYIVFISLLILVGSCKTEPFPNSQSLGTVSKGQLIKGAKFAKRGENYKYFSTNSYYLFNRAWVHSTVKKITLDAYAELHKTHPNRKFMIMECSKKRGGRMWPHRTHQNGTSIDFATPLLKHGKPYHGDHFKGVWHYAMRFDKTGRLTRKPKITIDFETMGEHILLLDSIARRHKMYVKKVLLKIDLKDDFYKSQAGKAVKKQKIYFAQYLTPKVDAMHDDHYHIDFAFL